MWFFVLNEGSYKRRHVLYLDVLNSYNPLWLRATPLYMSAIIYR